MGTADGPVLRLLACCTATRDIRPDHILGPPGGEETPGGAGRKQIFPKIAQAFGQDDIDFKFLAFSKTFCIRGKDKQFACNFCNASVIQYLLANQDIGIEA